MRACHEGKCGQNIDEMRAWYEGYAGNGVLGLRTRGVMTSSAT